MNEMRVNEVFMVGRIAQGPVRTNDDLTHFMFEGLRGSDPFHCVCDGRTAENLKEHCSSGDEMSLEGQLRWMTFPNTGKTLIICVRYISYGRKVRGSPEDIGLG